MSDLATNTETLNRHLARFRTDGVLNLIGGESRPAASGATFETTSPVDESVICSVAKGGTEDINAAALAAKAAFPAWRDMPAWSARKSCTASPI